MTSPTQRSLAHMRKQGYLCAITEHYNMFAKVRQDLFGFIDILAIRHGDVIAIQTTSGSNVEARVKKIQSSPALPIILNAGWQVHVHGWKKNKSGRYELVERIMSV